MVWECDQRAVPLFLYSKNQEEGHTLAIAVSGKSHHPIETLKSEQIAAQVMNFWKIRERESLWSKNVLITTLLIYFNDKI